MKEFKSAAKGAADEILGEAATIEFKYDGRTLTVEPPSSGQLAWMIAQQASSVDAPDQMAATFDFLKRLMSDDDYAYLAERLRDGEMSMSTYMEIIEYLTEEWTAVPTTAAPASSSQRRSTGRPSTGTRRSTA